jgi:hypothetical protein
MAREFNPKLKIGICGEHGGDPESVKFCHFVGMDYVSCSPYRVPIARLAAAQAVIEEARVPRRRGEVAAEEGCQEEDRQEGGEEGDQEVRKEIRQEVAQEDREEIGQEEVDEEEGRQEEGRQEEVAKARR